jgi:hypothetical protein
MSAENEPQLPAGDAAQGELRLPAKRSLGGWADPKSGADFEESSRQARVELSRRKASGPIRCVLHARPGAAAKREPELEVELKNASGEPVTLTVHTFLLDLVTFVFRDPDDQVVGTFCYVLMHSHFPFTYPTVTLKADESKASGLHLSVAAFRGYQDLKPGLYSSEAVFEARSSLGRPVPDVPMLARAARLLVRVSDF